MLHTMKIIFTIIFIVLPLTALKGGTTAEVKLLRTSHVKLMSISMLSCTVKHIRAFTSTHFVEWVVQHGQNHYCVVQLTHTNDT
jgi:hypothetical protein